MNFPDKMQLLNDTIKKFGVESQIIKCGEECSELLIEIFKTINGNIQHKNLIEEMVDVSIMIEQMKIIYGGEYWNKIEDEKLNRLRGILSCQKKD